MCVQLYEFFPCSSAEGYYLRAKITIQTLSLPNTFSQFLYETMVHEDGVTYIHLGAQCLNSVQTDLQYFWEIQASKSKYFVITNKFLYFTKVQCRSYAKNQLFWVVWIEEWTEFEACALGFSYWFDGHGCRLHSRSSDGVTICIGDVW